jgi:diguanylate cyclase (GGDEF)-like protein
VAFAGTVAAWAVPAAMLPSLLLLCIAAFAWLVVRSTDRVQVAESDVSTIVQSLDRIGGGTFEPYDTGVLSPGADRIDSAVRSMARQLHAQVGALRNAAQIDSLTGMANRVKFERLVELQLNQRPSDGLCALLFIDIDGFKDVNDTLGHHLGDRLLQGIGERLKLAGQLNPHGLDPAPEVLMARLGGDEFVIFLSGLTAPALAHRLAHRILRVLVEPFEIGARVAGVRASVGLAFAPQDATRYHELLRTADAAMYHAKRAGGNCVKRYSAELDAELHQQAALERDLREALVRGEFELHYQPQYDCRGLKVSSAEALIRWRHPRRGFVSPADFIPLAEKSGLICDIGEWVICEAAATIARLERLGLPLRISVNVSAQQLDQIEFVSLVKAALARSGASARLLEVEITESCAMRDSAMAADRLARLADLGIAIAVDDFGTGYSNLASLIRLPISRLKIDRSLLYGLTERSEVRTLAQTIISLANGLGLHTVAEGIEDFEQLSLLTSMGCDVVQGFYLSRPIDQRALEQLLAEAGRCDALFPPLAAVAC